MLVSTPAPYDEDGDQDCHACGCDGAHGRKCDDDDFVLIQVARTVWAAIGAPAWRGPAADGASAVGRDSGPDSGCRDESPSIWIQRLFCVRFPASRALHVFHEAECILRHILSCIT